ncbi:nuclear transport factor 2 family protein, partial [Achromobacter xylosoxidans]
DEVERLLAQYREALLSGEYETLFPLFADDVVWQEGGDNPLSGEYRGRGGLIDLFSRVMDYSRNTFTVDSVGQPALAGRAIAVP